MDDIWWAMLFVFFYIPFMFLWGFTLVDIFVRRDLHAWSKVLWALVVLFIPLLGVLFYFITRPKDYDTRPTAYGQPYSSQVYTDQVYTDSVRASSAAGPAPAPNDMAALAHMHEGGVLTDSEFESIRGRLAAT